LDPGYADLYYRPVQLGEPFFMPTFSGRAAAITMKRIVVKTRRHNTIGRGGFGGFRSKRKAGEDHRDEFALGRTTGDKMSNKGEFISTSRWRYMTIRYFKDY